MESHAFKFSLKISSSQIYISNHSFSPEVHIPISNIEVDDFIGCLTSVLCSTDPTLIYRTWTLLLPMLIKGITTLPVAQGEKPRDFLISLLFLIPYFLSTNHFYSFFKIFSKSISYHFHSSCSVSYHRYCLDCYKSHLARLSVSILSSTRHLAYLIKMLQSDGHEEPMTESSAVQELERGKNPKKMEPKYILFLFHMDFAKCPR